MTSSDGRWVIAFNGEIYGFRALRDQLASSGTSFRGSSDTEVLLEAIVRWGVEATLARVNAMYGLAAWDTDRRELWLARDPAGEKPLYIWEAGERIVFASELGAIEACPGFDEPVDAAAAGLYFQLGHIPAPHSIYRNVRKLEAGSWWCIGPHGIRKGATEPSESDGGLDGDHLLETLKDAVAIRTVADVPVGVFLSGGVDSTIVAALAAQIGTTKTYTAAFAAASHDERHHAAAVAQALGTDHTELEISSADGLVLAEQIPGIYGEPFADPSAIPTMLLAQEARTAVTVALTGDGGDELFGGYNRLVEGARLDALRHRLPAPGRRLAAAAGRAVPPATADRWVGRAFRVAGRAAIPNSGEKLHKAAQFLAARSQTDAIGSLLSPWPDPSVILDGAARADLNIDRQPFGEALLDFDRRVTLPEQMLTKVDRATMRVGLEARPPLLDPRVVALARAATLEHHLGDGRGKQLLRDLIPRLIDPTLVDRAKMGFDPPYGAWLRGPLKAWAQPLLEPDALRASGVNAEGVIAETWAQHQSGARNAEQSLWALLQYQAWWASKTTSSPTGDTPPRERIAIQRTPPPPIEYRPSQPEDWPQIERLLTETMTHRGDPNDYHWFLHWKHQENPFGVSPGWVATHDERVVGFRTFLRWRFCGASRQWTAVRAVDTVTDRAYQGHGIFKRLTTMALDAMLEEGVDFVFNTPNEQSRPGYLKMGWQMIGRPTPWVRLARPSSIASVARSRAPASLWGEPTSVGQSATEAFAEDAATSTLIEAATPSDNRFRTDLSPEVLRWRYAERLGYRVLGLDDDIGSGAAIFRLRRRGAAVEASISHLLVPQQRPEVRRRLLRDVLRRTGADHALLLGASVRDLAIPVVGQGPTLVWRHLRASEPAAMDAWDLSMGDLELF